MKRIFIVFFIFAVLGGKALWTLQSNANRDYNRHTHIRKDTGLYYITLKGADLDGDISSYAKTVIDVDRPFENIRDQFWKIQRNGVEYDAYARIFADASTGSWTVSAEALDNTSELSGIVNGDTYRVASKSGFEWCWGDPGEAEEHMDNASSTAKVATKGFSSVSKIRAADFPTPSN